MSVHVRRLSERDGPALVAFVDGAAARGELRASSPWLEHGLMLSMINTAEVAVAEDETGLVGTVMPSLKAVIVDPARRRRGIGTLLVEEGIAIERDAGRTEVFLGVAPGDASGEAFLRATGFAFHSTVWDLELPASTPVRPAVVPDGHVVRPFRRAIDLDEWIGVFNAAFADHPTPLQLDAAAVARWSEEPGVRDEDTLIVEDGDGRIAAFASTDPRYAPDGSVAGRAEVWALGVRPDAQGRGLGRVALREGIARLRAIGVPTVTLSVSGRNERAFALYQGEGFVRVATRDRWSRHVDEPGAAKPAAPDRG